MEEQSAAAADGGEFTFLAGWNADPGVVEEAERVASPREHDAVAEGGERAGVRKELKDEEQKVEELNGAKVDSNGRHQRSKRSPEQQQRRRRSRSPPGKRSSRSPRRYSRSPRRRSRSPRRSPRRHSRDGRSEAQPSRSERGSDPRRHRQDRDRETTTRPETSSSKSRRASESSSDPRASKRNRDSESETPHERKPSWSSDTSRHHGQQQGRTGDVKPVADVLPQEWQKLPPQVYPNSNWQDATGQPQPQQLYTDQSSSFQDTQPWNAAPQHRLQGLNMQVPVQPGPDLGVQQQQSVQFNVPEPFRALYEHTAVQPVQPVQQAVEPDAGNEIKEPATTLPPSPKVDDAEGNAAEKPKKDQASKALKPVRVAVTEYVKEALKPTWKEGQMSKEVYKTIVKKAVDKVLSTLTTPKQIPRTQEKVDHFMSFSRQKISKLVQGYVEKYHKAS